MKHPVFRLVFHSIKSAEIEQHATIVLSLFSPIMSFI